MVYYNWYMHGTYTSTSLYCEAFCLKLSWNIIRLYAVSYVLFNYFEAIDYLR
jgi:hypothetical protein